jgi:hypothetical protein
MKQPVETLYKISLCIFPVSDDQPLTNLLRVDLSLYVGYRRGGARYRKGASPVRPYDKPQPLHALYQPLSITL